MSQEKEHNKRNRRAAREGSRAREVSFDIENDDLYPSIDASDQDFPSYYSIKREVYSIKNEFHFDLGDLYDFE